MLGIDTYSLKSLRWNVFQLLDYAHSQNLKAIQASAVNFESLDDAYLTKVKAHADSLHIHLEPGFNCISTIAKSWNPKEESPAKYLAKAIRATRTLKARAFRVFIAGPNDRAAGTTPEAFIDEVVKSLKQIRTQAEDAQVKVAIENHGEFHSRHIRTIVEQAGPSYTAVCYDAGNPVLTVEDPLAVLENLAPYIACAHIRDSVVFPHRRGAAVQWVAMGDGSIDLKALTAKFKQLCPPAPYHLEIITGRPPQIIAYREAAFWKTDPTTPASSLARFEKLVREGHPFMGAMVIPAPGEHVEALKLQEKTDLERSLAYTRQHLFPA